VPAAAHGWTPAAAGSHAAGRTAREIAVAPIAAELLALLTAALMARTESAARSSGGLPDREFGNRARRRLLPFRPRQRGADQRPMNRTVFFGAGTVRRAVIGSVRRMIAVCRLGIRRLVAVVAYLEIVRH
jgi:hypothetical protein